MVPDQGLVRLQVLALTSTGLRFTSFLNHVKDRFLQVCHNRVGPKVGVPVEIRRKAMLAGEMQADRAPGKGFEPVLASQDIEERAADTYVFVQSGRRNLIGLGVNGECQAAFRLLDVHILDKQDAMLKGRMTDTTGTLE